LLQCRDGQQWFVLCLPAIADRADDPLKRKPGEALWPEWFSNEHFEKFRGNTRTWSALFQQKPRPGEGAEFKKQWLQTYLKAPPRTNKIMLVDPSSGRGKKDGDYFCAWILGLAADQNAYVLDCVRDRLNLTQRVDAVMELHRKWKPLETRYEQYGLQADVEAIRSEQERQQYRFKITEVGGRVSKEDRIRRLIPWFERGRIYLPVALPYTNVTGETVDLLAEFKKEYEAFPVARHDDMMDSLARLDEPGLKLPFPEEQRVISRVPAYRSSVPGMGPLG
jgi:predicted phage terminase large subunit-like protein